MSITRREAKLIAEELCKIIRAEIKENIQTAVKTEVEPLIGIEEAAAYIDMSVRFIREHLDDIPHTRVGKCLKSTKSTLRQYIEQ